MDPRPIAVISSTTHGLVAHRKAALDACLREDFLPKMMEQLGPRPDDPATLSVQLVDEADVYVLILGPRYGEVPAGHDRSYTHLELDRAVERGIPRLVLLMDMDKHPLVGSDVETGPGAERLRELRERLRTEQGVGFFSSVDDMRAQLIHGLSRLKRNLRPDSSSLHYVRQLTSPPQPYVAHPYTLLQTTDVIGRQRELNMLTDWVAGPDSALFQSAVLAVIAIGGMGKSAVTWKWFNDIAPNEMPALRGRMWWSFYESDASFDNFVIRALAYVSRRPIEAIKRLRPGEREDELLDALHEDPYLIVLDGLERLLIAYSRADASRFADDDLDVRAANVVAGALGLPESAAQSYTGQSRLRLAADPRAGAFLGRLAQVGASRILVSSRLFPAELQNIVTGEPVQGAAAYFLAGLDPAEAVQLWRAFRVTGRRDELVKLFATFDNYPLLIRALAGEVARFRRAPGDFDAWRAAHRKFDPFRLPLTQRKAHVLLFALRGLTKPEQRLLHLVAAFRMPAQFATLAAILIDEKGPFTDEAQLDTALFNLEDRGLLGWDKRANRYDLHPVVRGVTWSTVDHDAQQDIYRELAAHFEVLPTTRDRQVTSMDDLTPQLELFHTLVRLHRGHNAWNLLVDDLIPHAGKLGAFRELGELCEALLNDAGAVTELDADDEFAVAGNAGLLFQLSGQPWRYLEACDKIITQPGGQDVRGNVFAFRAMAQHQVGDLVGAHRSVVESMAVFETELDERPWAPWVASLAHGTLLATRGEPDAATWLLDPRMVNADAWPGFPFNASAECELGHLALRDGDPDGARRWVNRAGRIAARAEYSARLKVAVLRAAIALEDGDVERADEELYPALVGARETRLADEEAGILIMLARCRLRAGDLYGARQRLLEADPLIERGRLRLRRADARALLSSVEHAAGNRAAAATAAVEAWEAAWCDGPPFAYAEGLRRARDCAAAAGIEEPEALPSTVPAELAEPSVRPLTIAETIELATGHGRMALQALADAGEDGLNALLGLALAGSSRVRAAAVHVLADPDHVDPAVWQGLWPRLADDADDDVRGVVVDKLGHAVDDSAIDLLVGLAERDTSSEVRTNAVLALASNDRGLARLPALMRTMAVADPDPGLRADMLYVLAGADDPATGTDDPDTARTPLLGPEELTRFLWQRLKEEAEPAVQEAALALLLRDDDHQRWHRAFDKLAKWLRKNRDRPLNRFPEALATTSPGRAPDVVERVVAERLFEGVHLQEYFRSVVAEGGAAAWATLCPYLTHPAHAVHSPAFYALAENADQPDRTLLSRDLDGLEPYVKHNTKITKTFVKAAATRLGMTTTRVRAHYERLAETFPLRLTWRE